MPSIAVQKRVVSVMQSLPGWPALRVLDLSCGEGRVLERLARAGCDVQGTHYRSDDYILKNPASILSRIPIHQNVDLTQPLPFENQSFDVVIATEVIEHLPSHAAFIQEAARLVKPGGHLILTTPNIHRLHSRWQFALTGQHELRSARFGWETPADELYTTHHNPVYFPTLHVLLHQHGMRMVQTRFTTCKPVALLLLPLLPLIYAATALEARHQIKRHRTGGRDLLRWMLDPRILFSDQLVVCARHIEA